MKKTAIILIRKGVSERIYEVINAHLSGNEYQFHHTQFAPFDGKEICACFVIADAMVIYNLSKWLHSEFSDSAVWIETIDDGRFSMFGSIPQK